MRVAMVASAVPPRTGGAEVSVALQAAGLARRGVVVDLLAGNEPAPALRAGFTASGGTTIVAASSPPAGRVPWEHEAFDRAHALHRHLATTEVDVVHAFSHASALAAAIALTGTTRPALLASFHEITAQTTADGRAQCAFVYALERIDLHVTLSGYYDRVAASYGVPAERRRRARQGIEVERFANGSRSAGRRMLRIGDGERVVLCPSRFARWKGQLELVRAAGRLRRDGRDLRLVLAGSLHGGTTAYREELEREIAALGLTDRVDLLEDVPYEHMPDVLASADVVVQPSHREGLGLAAVEAMAAGVPVVAAAVTGLDEYCVDGHNCLTFPARDEEALAVALRRLLDEPSLGARLVAGGSRTAEDLDAGDGVDDLLALYEELTSAAPA
ncbi:MAG TPA: glycosyltransferase family 4 protein [Solirubrobacteraceae bacterium]